MTMLPEIHYRLMESDDLSEWSVRWQMGLVWVPVFGPVTEWQAREWLEGMKAQSPL